MNKKFLVVLAAPALMLAACNGGVATDNFVKCQYLSVGGSTLVSEYGVFKEVKMVATYIVGEDDLEDLDEVFVAFPSTFTVYSTYTVNPTKMIVPEEHVPAESIVLQAQRGAFAKTCDLYLKENSVAYYETYADYYYSELTRTIKTVTHEEVRNVASSGTYESAYSGSLIAITSTADGEEATSDYKVMTPSCSLAEKSYERYISLGEDDIITYTLEKSEQ